MVTFKAVLVYIYRYPTDWVITYWKLTHLHNQQVPSQLVKEAPHDQFVDACRKEECNECCGVLVHFHG